MSPGSTSSPGRNSELLGQFLQSLVDRKAAQRTIKAYTHDIQKLIEFCGKDVTTLQSREIESYTERLARSGAKYATVKRTLSALREFFSFLIDNGEIVRSPAENVKITALPKNVLSSEDVVTIFQYISQHQRSKSSSVSVRYRREELILMLMVFFGVRQYHIPHLKLSAIGRNEEVFMLRVNDRLSAKLTGDMLSKLREYLSLRTFASDTIFLDPLDGLPIAVSAVHLLLRELNERAGIRCSSLALYHTFLHLLSEPEERRWLLSTICSSDLQVGPSTIPLEGLVHA